MALKVVFNPFTAKFDYVQASGAGASTFLGLTDTPAAYTAKAGYMPLVNTGETALEFVTAVQAFDGGTFSDTYIDTVDFDGGAF